MQCIYLDKKNIGSHGNRRAHIQAHLLHIVLISLALIAFISISMAAFVKQASIPRVYFPDIPSRRKRMTCYTYLPLCSDRELDPS